MSNKDNGGPAFPCEYEGSTRSDAYGMTLRDYFAAKAMQGVLSNMKGNVGVSHEGTNRGIAACAYAIADAMLQERAK